MDSLSNHGGERGCFRLESGVAWVKIEGEVNVGGFWFIMHGVAGWFSVALTMHSAIREMDVSESGTNQIAGIVRNSEIPKYVQKKQRRQESAGDASDASGECLTLPDISSAQ